MLHTRQYADGSRWRTPALATFTVALLTNEAGVTLLPVLVIWDVCFRKTTSTRVTVRRYLPFLLILFGYLAVEILVTRRNYVVTEGHYRIGAHVVWNVLHYIAWIGVGRRDVWSLVAIAVTLGVLIAAGSRAGRFAALWLVITLAPVAPFTWALSPRYTYLPSVGFSLLLAVLCVFLFSRTAARWTSAAGYAVMAVLAAAIAVRSAAYARQGIEDLCHRAGIYQQYAGLVRESLTGVGHLSTVTVPSPPPEIAERFLQPLVEVTFRTRVTSVESSSR
jgi:hypothetical protein